MKHITYRSLDTGETIHERDEDTFPTGPYTELDGKRYAIRRLDVAGNEAHAFVTPSA